MKKAITILILFVSMISCDKNRPLKENSLTVDNYLFSKCEKNTKALTDRTVTLEMRENGILHLYREGDFHCSAEMAIDITNEGNTININERNVGMASYCFCHTSYNCEIKGFREGEYILCISTEHTRVDKFQYKPITFSFVEGNKITFDLGEGSRI